MNPMRLPAIFAVAIILSACDRLPEVNYSGFADIPSEGMPEGWSYQFCPTEKDSLPLIQENHNAVIVVRYSAQCPSKSIFLNLEENSFSHSSPDSLSVEIPLFSKNGKPLGKGVYGVFEISDTIHRDFKVPDGYQLTVSSPVPSEHTKGIKAVGLVITKN